MATVTPNVDPTTITPVAPKSIKVSAPKPTSVAGTVTPIPTSRRKGRVTKADVEFARKMTGYNDTSPIWGKRLSEVLVSIEAHLASGIAELQLGSYANAQTALDEALTWNQELQKRVATNALVATQRK